MHVRCHMCVLWREVYGVFEGGAENNGVLGEGWSHTEVWATFPLQWDLMVVSGRK